jgi:polyhydroxybutyrate depolymerase
MQQQRQQFSFDGRVRNYLLFTPEHADGRLLIGLHGATQRGSLMARSSGFAERPEAAGMTLVFPDAVDGIWRDGRAEDDDVDDVGFIDALIEQLLDSLPLHADKVFLVGASNGGCLSQRLLCELEGRFRAVATVIATMGLKTFQQAYIDSIPSLYLIAGTQDPIIPFEGGTTPNSLMASADAPIVGFDDLVTHWKQLGGFGHCTQAQRSASGSTEDELVIRQEKCRSDDGRLLRATVVEGGGHQWYGREVTAQTVRQFGATTTDFNVSRDILEFFVEVLLRTEEHPG